MESIQSVCPRNMSYDPNGNFEWGKWTLKCTNIAIRVYVSMRVFIQELLQLWSIDEVAVVGEADAVRIVHIERLGLCVGASASCWIPQVPNTYYRLSQSRRR